MIVGLVGAYQIISALIDGFAAVCIAREDMHSAVAVVLLFVIFRVVIKNYEHIKLSFYGDGIFLSAAAVGDYNVAYRVVFILMFVPGFTALALFPIGFSF